jgi:hypothetical protein
VYFSQTFSRLSNRAPKSLYPNELGKSGLSDKRSDESVECGTSSPIDLTRLHASATTSGRTQIGTSVSESGSSAPVIADPDTVPEEARRSAPKAGKRGSLDEQAKSDPSR